MRTMNDNDSTQSWGAYYRYADWGFVVASGRYRRRQSSENSGTV